VCIDEGGAKVPLEFHSLLKRKTGVEQQRVEEGCMMNQDDEKRVGSISQILIGKE